MKYIRTKDGIQDTQRLFGNVSEYIKDYAINQADTIEDLCDNFVVSGNTFLGKPFVLVKSFKTLQEQNDIRLYENCELFGAIWTDKGLIYVAKMNDKGEMELL